MNKIKDSDQETSSQLFRVVDEQLPLDSSLILFDWIDDNADGIIKLSTAWYPRVDESPI